MIVESMRIVSANFDHIEILNKPVSSVNLKGYNGNTNCILSLASNDNILDFFKPGKKFKLIIEEIIE